MWWQDELVGNLKKILFYLRFLWTWIMCKKNCPFNYKWWWQSNMEELDLAWYSEAQNIHISYYETKIFNVVVGWAKLHFQDVVCGTLMQPNTIPPQSRKLSWIADSGGLYLLGCCCSDLWRLSCLYMAHRWAVFFFLFFQVSSSHLWLIPYGLYALFYLYWVEVFMFCATQLVGTDFFELSSTWRLCF